MGEVRERQGTRERPERRRSHPRESEREAPEQVQGEEAPEAEQAQAEEAPEPEQAQERPEEADEESTQKKSWLSRIGLPVLGWGLVLLVLAGYFVWLASQMGTAAVTGIGPLVAVFAAAAVGVLLAGAALVLAKRVREK